MLNSDQQRALDRVQEKLAETREELERILVISRLERNFIDTVEVVLEDEVQRAVSRGTAKADLVGGRIHLHPRRKDAASVDRLLLTQVLDNLIDNALTYTDAPPFAWIEVGAVPHPWVRLHDSGFGFSEAGAGCAFDSGYREHPADSRRSGSGVGLYLSRRAAERMGGSLELERSRPGAGSTFLLALASAAY